MQIESATALPPDLFTDPFVSYSFKYEKNATHKTDVHKGAAQTANFNYSKLHHIPTVAKMHTEYFETSALALKIYALPYSCRNH